MDIDKIKSFIVNDIYDSLIPKYLDAASKKLPSSLRKSRNDLIISSLAINVLSLMLPLATLQVYDRILGYASRSTLDMLFFAVLIAIVLELILKITRAYTIDWAGSAHEHTMNCYAINHILECDLKHISQGSVGQHVQNIDAIAKMREFFSGQIFVTVLDLPFILVFLLLIAYLGGFLVLIPIALLVLYAYIVNNSSKKLKDHILERNTRDETRYSYLIETLNGIHTVKSYGLEEIFMRRYQNLSYRTSIANYHIAQDNLHSLDYGALFTSLMAVAVITVGAPLAVYGNISMGTLIACILLAGRLMQPVQRAFGLWTRMQEHLVNQEKVKKIFELPITKKIEEKEVHLRNGSLEIKNMSFAYSFDGSDPILKNISLTIKPGDCIAITGDDSSGCSTLLKVIAGIYYPSNGEILIDGVSVEKYPSSELINHVGYIPTQGVVFEGTVRDNLTRFGQIPLEQAIEVASLLGIDKEVSVLPGGYDTLLQGQNTDNLTPGVRQRISIARAIASKPKIILFDTADRALDKEGYNLVYKLLGRLKSKVTIIIVSDDLNLLKLVNKGYILENGVLKEANILDDSKYNEILPYEELNL